MICAREENILNCRYFHSYQFFGYSSHSKFSLDIFLSLQLSQQLIHCSFSTLPSLILSLFCALPLKILIRGAEKRHQVLNLWSQTRLWFSNLSTCVQLRMNLKPRLKLQEKVQLEMSHRRNGLRKQVTEAKEGTLGAQEREG